MREFAVLVCCFEVYRTSNLPAREYGFILFACTKRTGSTPEVCEPLDSGDDSNLRSIHDFRRNDRPSSCNRQRRKPQRSRASPADLNRCEVPALQRKDLERTTKEWPYSLRTVGSGLVGMGGVGCGNVLLSKPSSLTQLKFFCGAFLLRKATVSLKRPFSSRDRLTASWSFCPYPTSRRTPRQP